MTNVDTKIHSLLDPSNCCLLMIDFQPQMCFAVASMDGQTLIHNAGGMAESAKIFNIPTVLTSVAEKSFSMMQEGVNPMMIPSTIELHKYQGWQFYNEWLELNTWRLFLELGMGW